MKREKWTPKRELTQTDVAYLAGLFDGEGCVSILKIRNPRKNFRGRVYGVYVTYTLQLRIGNTSTRLMDWLQANVGGAVYKQTYITNWRGNRKQAYHWHLGGQKAGDFLQLIRPYLLIKGPQADTAFEFLALGSDYSHSARSDLREQMRLLNSRGIGKQNGGSARQSQNPNGEAATSSAISDDSA